LLIKNKNRRFLKRKGGGAEKLCRNQSCFFDYKGSLFRRLHHKVDFLQDVFQTPQLISELQK